MKPSYFTNFLQNLESHLKELPHSHQLAFAASCCERAYPNYEAFSEKEGWGDIVALRSSLDSIWQFVTTGDFAHNSLSILLDKCKAATPDSDMFDPKTEADSVLITAGQEAAFMVTLLLEFCTDQNPRHAADIASLARDTVDRQVQAIENVDPSDPKLEERVAQHLLMCQEFQKQKHDLSVLGRIEVRSELIEFRRCAVGPKSSNIGIMSRSMPPSLHP